MTLQPIKASFWTEAQENQFPSVNHYRLSPLSVRLRVSHDGGASLKPFLCPTSRWRTIS